MILVLQKGLPRALLFWGFHNFILETFLGGTGRREAQVGYWYLQISFAHQGKTVLYPQGCWRIVWQGDRFDVSGSDADSHEGSEGR